MDISPAEQYFELALDLPVAKRDALLAQLTRQDPALAEEVRGMLERWLVRGDFSAQAGVSGVRERTASRQYDALHHVAIPVQDIGAAIDWYRARFAFEVEYQDDSWALLRFANFRLAFVLPGRHPAHFAVLRSDASSFGALTEHRDGTRSIYAEDPWGNAVEVLDAASVPTDGEDETA